MPWNDITHQHHNRDGLRYSSDLTEREWFCVGPDRCEGLADYIKGIGADKSCGIDDLTASSARYQPSRKPVENTQLFHRVSRIVGFEGMVGWGPRIRTWTYGVRVRCPTIRRVPKKRRASGL